MENSKVTKANLIDSVYEATNFEKQDIRVIIDSFIDTIKDELSSDKIIELRGFGTFALKFRKARENARNPKTGQTISSPSHCIASFRAGKELKERVWDVKKDTEK